MTTPPSDDPADAALALSITNGAHLQANGWASFTFEQTGVGDGATIHWQQTGADTYSIHETFTMPYLPPNGGALQTLTQAHDQFGWTTFDVTLNGVMAGGTFSLGTFVREEKGSDIPNDADTPFGYHYH